MLRLLSFLFLACLTLRAEPAAAQETTRTFVEIISRARLPISFEGGMLSGPGAARVIEAADSAQFVILVESHNDHATPLITGDLFRQLNEAYRFKYLAIEQDPFGMEAASTNGRRGRLDQIAVHACKYPYSYTFATDEELRLLAMAGTISNARIQPVWGIDQVFGATAPLEELFRISRGTRAGLLVQELLLDARASEEKRDEEGRRDQQNHHFLASGEFELLQRFKQVRKEMKPEAGTRAEALLDALETSAEIYSYFNRARELDETEAPIGLRNNWVREDWMKAQFMHHYRAAQAAGDPQPKVLVKAGYWHTVRGRGPGNVFTLGNFLHEFAIANGQKALSVQVVPLREWWPNHASVDPEYRVLLESKSMHEATLVDMRSLRAYLHAGQTFSLEPAELRRFHDLVFGVDLALFIPSRAALHTLTSRRCSRMVVGGT
ncbi:hypothetical protein J4558_12735 [Leptolyngbya sp. 15MV]|nr:hypothetical protein J4558_12735 [Leptolyngbya sp. 15MV]